MYQYSKDLFLWVPLILFTATVMYAAISNPYSFIGRVKNPFKTVFSSQEISLSKNFDVIVRKSLFWVLFAYIKCGWHIVSNVHGGLRTKSKNLKGIVSDIHKVRFRPEKPYLISGDHFNVFYPRNLGVFYHSTLDGRTSLSESDWENRQRVYLQTTAYALNVFSQYGDCTTTIVPVGAKSVSCINIYNYPSDALYGVLYALSTMMDNTGLYKLYSFDASENPPLHTKDAAKELLDEYKNDLSKLVNKYYKTVFDEEGGLIRKDIHLSSAKDITRRISSFYDNVIFWKTFSLAYGLGLKNIPKVDLEILKKRIIKEFWSEEAGYFIEDLSVKSIEEKYYSADWLAAFFTGFLDPQNNQENYYLNKSVAVTIAKDLDLPFPLRYQENDRAQRQNPLVRFTVPSYGGTSIWSFWGAEFIKLLLVLSKINKNEDYLKRAGEHIKKYEGNIIRYQGYPETYNNRGDILRTPFYRSVRRTGWVVEFEQATALFNSLSQ